MHGCEGSKVVWNVISNLRSSSTARAKTYLLLMGVALALGFSFVFAIVYKMQPLSPDALSRAYSPLTKRADSSINTILAPPGSIAFVKHELKNCTNTDDYFLFTKKTKNYLTPISDEYLAATISAMKDEYDYSLHSADQLVREIKSRLNLSFLLEDIDSRLLEVQIVDEKKHFDYFRQDLVFRDPYVGTFEAILLGPIRDGSHPAIVAVHGHSSSAQNYVWDFKVSELSKRGYIVIIPSLRGICGDENEDKLVRHLLKSGFSSIGIVVYETILMEKYLRSLAIVDDRNIGLIGHSGGSAANNITIHIDGKFKAYVADHFSKYQGVRPFGDKLILLESFVPALWELAEDVNSFRFCPVPVLKTSYAYSEEFGAIYDFFDKHLK